MSKTTSNGSDVSIGSSTTFMNWTPAMHQSLVQSVQCKLIVLRISELRQIHGGVDDVFDRAFANLQLSVDRLTSATRRHRDRLRQMVCDSYNTNTINNCDITSTSQKRSFQDEERSDDIDDVVVGEKVEEEEEDDPTTLNAGLRRAKSEAALTLVHAAQLAGGDGRAERVVVWQRAKAFALRGDSAMLRRAVRVELAHLRATFDRAIAIVDRQWTRPVRSAFLVRVLPRFPLQEEAKEDGNCAICCERMDKGCTVARFTVCGHLFHAECLDRWLLDQGDTCPLCRCDLHPLYSQAIQFQKRIGQ